MYFTAVSVITSALVAVSFPILRRPNTPRACAGVLPQARLRHAAPTGNRKRPVVNNPGAAPKVTAGGQARITAGGQVST